MTIKPTIGRRVWYWPSEQDTGNHDVRPISLMTAKDPTQACDAGIAYVWHDRLVNLTVSDHNGKMHARCSVPLMQDGDPEPLRGTQAYATWMPYQQAQATAQTSIQRMFGGADQGEHAVDPQRLDVGATTASIDYRDRVRAEHAELTGRLTRLRAFIGGDAFTQMGPAEQRLLTYQETAMTEYADVLAMRIERFTDTPAMA